MRIFPGTIKRIHINKQVIAANRKRGDAEIQPPISIKTGGENYKAFRVSIGGPSVVVYSPDKPLPCGARLWIETHSEVSF